MQQFILSGFLLLFLCASIFANENDIQPDQRLLYKTTPQGELYLHVFNPKNHTKDANSPAILFFFGGGWSGGTPKQFYEQARELNKYGVVAFCAEYRVKRAHKTTPFECVADGKSAVRHLRKQANELGINPQKIIASGGSAGGHVAACTGTIIGYDDANEDSKISSLPNAMILFNPVIDTTEKGYGLSSVGVERKTEISPVHHVRSGIPPTLIMHGTADTTTPFENVERFTKLMHAEENHCTLIPYVGKKHGFFNGSFFRSKIRDNSDYKATMQECKKFLTGLGYIKPSTTPPN